jgi:hypothetical protein
MRIFRPVVSPSAGGMPMLDPEVTRRAEEVTLDEVERILV